MFCVKRHAYKKTEKWKIKGWEKTHHVNANQEKTGEYKIFLK